MDYEQLSKEARAEIARDSLLQVETEHYTLSLRLAAYDGAQDVDEASKREMERTTRERLASLEAAIEVYRRELAELE